MIAPVSVSSKPKPLQNSRRSSPAYSVLNFDANNTLAASAYTFAALRAFAEARPPFLPFSRASPELGTRKLLFPATLSLLSFGRF